MKLCDDCRQNLCDDCYQHDCDCNLSSHTAAAALLIRHALEIVNPDSDLELTVSYDLERDSDKTEMVLEINGRPYRVSVKG